ncbi:hypothetical protein PMAYCL1PPCAC_06986, partial [Pristionchus mayeri]
CLSFSFVFQMIRTQQIPDKGREEDVINRMAELKSYSSLHSNDISGLVLGMAAGMETLCLSKPVQELSKQIWALKRQLQIFPVDVNEHSKAIEALATMFVHTMELIVEREEKGRRKEKKQSEFIPSSHNTLQRSSLSHGHHNQYDRESSTQSLAQSMYQQGGYGERWEESRMDMNDFNLNRSHSSVDGGEEENGWVDGGEEMPLLYEEYIEGRRRCSGGLCEEEGGKNVERRYGGGLRGRRTSSISPTKNTIHSNSDPKLVSVPQIRIDGLVKARITRKGISASPNKKILKGMEMKIKREGSTIGTGKPNIMHENSILVKICPKSSSAQKYGVDCQGSSFISRSRARTLGMLPESEDNETRKEVIHERKTTALEETVVESRKKKEVKAELHDGRLVKNPVEATFNSNLSETWWAMGARRDGASLLSNRLQVHPFIYMVNTIYIIIGSAL